MRTFAFRIVNVFTYSRGALTGNPLCVFENAEGLDDGTMQALARQFNLSETTFIQPSTVADARVRIYTPSYEMPFAGHPTLGTAFVCRELKKGGDELRLEMKAGIIPVRAAGNRWTLQANAPTWRECEASPATLAAMLGLDVADIGERPLWVKAGKEQLIVPLKSEGAVRKARPVPELMFGVRSEDGHSMAYIFAMTGQSSVRTTCEGIPRETAADRVLSRFFFPDGAAILEDPATGSATANFGGWAVATRRQLPFSVQISQGEYVGRPSTLLLNVDAQGRIFVGGDVIELARGTLQLP